MQVTNTGGGGGGRRLKKLAGGALGNELLSQLRGSFCADQPDSLLNHPSAHSQLPKPRSLSNSGGAFTLATVRGRGKIDYGGKEDVWENMHEPGEI